MNKAASSVAMGIVALCAGPLLLLGPANAQYEDYGPGPGGPFYGAPPPAGPMGRAPGRVQRLSPYEVRDLVRGLGYRRVSEPELTGRRYVVTALDEGAPVAIWVDAYSGRVVDVQQLIYGRGSPEGYYPPEAPLPGKPARAARPAAPLPPARPFVPEATPRNMPEMGEGPGGGAPAVVVPEAQPYAPSAQGQGNGALSAQDDPGPAPQIVTPAGESAPPVALRPSVPENPKPVQQAPASSRAAAPAVPVAPAGAGEAGKVVPTPQAVTPPVAAAPVPNAGVGAGVGAGEGTPGVSSAGAPSVLSRPPASR